MKPRLKKISSLWYCYTWGCTGLGYTPFQAYSDWFTRNLRDDTTYPMVKVRVSA